MKQRQLVVLLVEDNDQDIMFIQWATEAATGGHSVYAVPDAREAMHYLRGEGRYVNRKDFPVPDVILTDLKMPRMNGFEFLRWLRREPQYLVTPTIVLSNSDCQADVCEAYRLGANCFVTKPTGLLQLAEALQRTYNYWSSCPTPFAGNTCWR